MKTIIQIFFFSSFLVCLLVSCKVNNDDQVLETPYCSNGNFCADFDSTHIIGEARYALSIAGDQYLVDWVDTAYPPFREISIDIMSNDRHLGSYDFSLSPSNGQAKLMCRFDNLYYYGTSGSVTMTYFTDSFASGTFNGTIIIDNVTHNISNGNFINVHY